MRHLLLSASILALAACGKSAAPAPTQAPAASAPAPAPAPAAPTPQSAPAPQPAPSQAPASPAASVPSSASASSAAAPQTAETSAPPQGPSTNPFENDMRGLEVAIRLCNEFEVCEDKVAFEFRTTMADGSKPIDEVFFLPRTDGVESALLARETVDGFYVTTYRLAEADYDRVHAAQTKLMELVKTSTGGNDLSFQVGAQTALKTGVEAPETFKLKIYARSHPSLDFVPLGDEQIAHKSDPKMAHLFTHAPQSNGQG